MLALLPQAIIDGVLLGGIYLTVAIGFSLAYGVLHIIDFAVGEWIMLGAFIGLTFTRWLGLDALLSLPVVFVLFAAAGWVSAPCWPWSWCRTAPPRGRPPTRRRSSPPSAGSTA